MYNESEIASLHYGVPLVCSITAIDETAGIQGCSSWNYVYRVHLARHVAQWDIRNRRGRVEIIT